MVRDELEMVNPAIAARHESQSFSQAEVNQINALLNTMAEQLASMDGQLNTLTTSSQFTYDDITELLEYMKDKFPYGKRDWLDLLKAKLMSVGMDDTISRTVVSPTLTNLEEVIARMIRSANLT